MIQEDKSKPFVVPYFLRKSGVATAGRGSKRQTRDCHDTGRQEEAFCCPVFPTEIGCSHSRERQQFARDKQETVMIQEDKSKLSVVPYFLRKSGVATAEEEKSKPSVVPYFLRKSGEATAEEEKRKTRVCCPVFPTEIGCSHSRGRKE